MKKIMISSLVFVIITISGCSSEELPEAGNQKKTSISQATTGSGNSLVVYFTLPEADGTDVSSGASRVESEGEIIGNTEQIARWIAAETGSDLFEVTAADAYPADHDELVEQADQELAADARPELAASIENLADYDTIFIGYPIWWSDLPMPVYTFFDQTNFSGKTIIPFSTHGGSGFSGTAETIADLEPEAVVETNSGLTISRNDIASSQTEVSAWLADFDFKK